MYKNAHAILENVNSDKLRRYSAEIIRSFVKRIKLPVAIK